LPPLFVYGTLRRGSPHPAAAWLRDGATWMGAARAAGRLLLVDNAGTRYPVLEPGGRGWVQGDIYTVDDAALWRRLDEYEGDQFQLIPIQVQLTSGSAAPEPVDAVAYAPVHAPGPGAEIPAGDWLAFLAPPQGL